ncbi:MAG TPA: phospholipase, partial [Ohtaekwangia sp.]
DGAVPVTVSRDWTKKLKELGVNVSYTEYPGVNHNSWENAYRDEAAFDWFRSFKRNKFPDRVLFNSRSYKYSQAYWVHFDLINPGTLATIDAKFAASNQLDIVTTNLGAFTLHLAGHPKFDASKPLQVTINGKKVKLTATAETLSFIEQQGKWAPGKFEPATFVKKPGAEGPIAAGFSQRHVYVYGTAGNPSEAELKLRMDIATQAASWSIYRNAFLGRIMVFPRIVADREVRPSDLESANLVLFGTKETNSLINQYSDKLPIQLNASAANDYGLFYILPMNNHYIVVNSGLPWWAGAQPGGLPFLPPALMALNQFKDFILFKNSTATVVTDGYFDQNWKLPAEAAKAATASGVVTVK